jgi:thiamine-phosphate pyrophosphorylase
VSAKWCPKLQKRIPELLLYYITDRLCFAGSEHQRREHLLDRAAEAARAGIDYIQLREKDLSSRELEELAAALVQRLRETGAATRILINSRSDVALVTGADGVHLTSNDISPADVRRIWQAGGREAAPLIGVSCHSEHDVLAAKVAGADFVVFGPIFGKSNLPGVGLSALSAACAHGIPVLALGGVNADNAQLCLEAGAAGIAGIRLFQDGDLNTTLARVRRHNNP